MKKWKTKKENHLKALNSISDSCCTYCNCDCLSSHDDWQSFGSKRTTTTVPSTQKKAKKTKRSRSANSSRKDCKVLKDIRLECLPKVAVTGSHDYLFDTSLDLCSSMQDLCLSSKVYDAFKKIPLHDKKIVNRMARSRSEKALMVENAWLARKYWENEKYERELLKCEQMVEYKKAVKDKQFLENEFTRARLAELNRRDLNELQKLRSELHVKDDRLKKRLQDIKLEKDIMQCQRREEELRKFEAVILAQEEHNIDNQLRKQNICLRLENRLNRAESMRQHILDAQLRRLKYDNFLEHALHEENYRETKEFEKFKAEDLKRRISKKTSLTDQFIQRKQMRNNEIIERAKISADLRDLVRKSVSPDGMHTGMAKPYTERSWSDLSFQGFA